MLTSNHLVKGFKFSLYNEVYILLGYNLEDDLLVVKSVKSGVTSTVPRLLVVVSGKEVC